MNVKLLEHTPYPEFQIAIAAKLCYSDKSIDDIYDAIESYAGIESMIRKIMKLGHHSVLEHASFTFGIEGISRVTSHQLVRHRVASYSQQSQRYVDSGNNATVTPPSVKNNILARAEFELALLSINHAYHVMTKLGIPAEDARYILPNATETKIIMTMNARELLHFFKLRCCNRAQWEIREMADKMLELAQEAAPAVFETAGAGCVSGPCPEGPYCCGNPKIQSVPALSSTNKQSTPDLKTENKDVCPKCGAKMADGKAIQQTLTGSPDFADGKVVTVSPGGPGKLIDCNKCTECGFSVSKS